MPGARQAKAIEQSGLGRLVDARAAVLDHGPQATLAHLLREGDAPGVGELDRVVQELIEDLAKARRISLGLVICKAIIEGRRGWILSSNKPHDAVFRLDV